jgi:hypothetical protein
MALGRLLAYALELPPYFAAFISAFYWIFLGSEATVADTFIWLMLIFWPIPFSIVMLITHAVGFEQSILMDITNYEQALFNLVRSAGCSGALTLVYAFWFWEAITSGIVEFLLQTL